jgi:energy-coupling factor transporter ATP-binding protein EcfA2
MITSVYIENNKETPIKYLAKLPIFKNKSNFEFKKGINIIVGTNGCGKTTLINLISQICLCHESLYSKLPKSALDYPTFLFKKNEVMSGAKIKSDYAGIVFRYKVASEMKGEECLNDIQNFALCFEGNNSSTGEKTLEALQVLFKNMNEIEEINFPIKELLKQSENSNDVWKERLINLVKYYRDNQIKIKQEDFEFTVLMDEPDRNLDIDNIQKIYDIVSYQRPNTQTIVVLHNPILIYKLSKLPYINWIEMSKGYLNKIIKFVENE